jgi:two-component system sensor kinase FixL
LRRFSLSSGWSPCCAGEIDRNRVELRTRLADDLPAIHGDKVQLQQVILNLIVNAIEATHEGEGRELLISCGKDDAQNVLVSVCDSGPGVDPANIDRVFDSFYTTKPAEMGMGCRSAIIAMHGGRIAARASAPRGAVFEFAASGSRTGADAFARRNCPKSWIGYDLAISAPREQRLRA